MFSEMYNFALRNPHFKITASPQKAATLVRHFYKETVVIINIRQLICFLTNSSMAPPFLYRYCFFFRISGLTMDRRCTLIAFRLLV